jgi:glycosyltransferase involved in cell wall biosynthesis
VVADWFDVPRWLQTLPRRIGIVIGLHGMWHVTGGCFLYRGCDRYADAAHPCAPCPILKWPANQFLANAAYARKLQVYQGCGPVMVANSHWLAEIAGRSAIAKACGGVRVIAPGIDTDIFKPQNKNLCRKDFGLPADAFVIATGATSLSDTNKNVRWLLEQLSHLPDLQHVTVLIFGEGTVPVPAGLNVRFAGGIRDRHDLARLYAAADVFVSASSMETYGLTLVEAMACGTPVVAFRVGGIPESVPDEQVGLLCTPQDGRELLAAVQKLRSSTQLREKFASAASDLARTRNAKCQFGAAFAQLYRDCLDRVRADASNQIVAPV